MAFENLLHWLEGKRDENLAKDEQVHAGTGAEMTAVEHPADGTWSPVIGNEVTSSGGMKLPPISGGVPDANATSL